MFRRKALKSFWEPLVVRGAQLQESRLRAMERNLVDVSAIPEKPNQTLNLDDDAEMFEDFKFLGGATLLEGPSFLHSTVQEEAKTS